ncbi:MAG: amidase [Terriglobia bacterium]
MGGLVFLSAEEMVGKIRKKEISPVELIEAHLARIDRLNPQLNAIISLDPDRVRREARRAEEALSRGAAAGSLHGVPVTIKSCIDVAGHRCEAGSKLRQGNVPALDAPLVARLRAAGAIILGTTNVAEMLMAYETDNPLYGRTNNPWALERTPGGSSGGEAAAIAGGLSAAGVGSDGGGSVRVPAHFSGICGLKPTPGRIPSSGHYPPGLGPFAWLGVVGPMARKVHDLKLLFEVMAGPHRDDPCAAPIPVRWRREEELRRLRVGYFEDDGCTPVTPETRAAVRTAAEALRRAGFQVAPFRPEGLEEARGLWGQFFAKGSAMLLRPLMGGREAHLPILKEFAESGPDSTPLTAESLFQIMIERDQLRARFLAQMEEYPILLCPVCALPAFRHGERRWTIDGKVVGYLDATRYSQWFNLLGNPAAVVPVASAEGLPIAVQVVGRPFEDEVVLAVAGRIEQELGDQVPRFLDTV